jgi:hypothetical protein
LTVRAGLRNLSLFLGPTLLLLAGCGGRVAANPSNATFSITPGTAAIDTNCTGCNTTGAASATSLQFSATLTGGGAAPVFWMVDGGDAVSGPGSINQNGQYTPPSYLTDDSVEVVVTAIMESGLRASSKLTITPGFLQPLTPENVAMGANGTVTVTGTLAEAGGSAGIHFALASSASGQEGGLGALSASNCQRGNQSFTTCTATYTAPAAVASTGVTYVVATVNTASSQVGSKTSAMVLVNAAGVMSNPASHQGQLPAVVSLGSSGGNNADYDTQGNKIIDCCSGTLGALVRGPGGREYLLSNNHVLARSDHASVGDTIVQPGLIDNSCTPLGNGSGGEAVASLTAWLPLSSRQTNVDAAIAQVTSRRVDQAGSILELGAKQADGTLSAAPPGISSTGGRGETATLDLKVAKSGRTTGLTCGGVSALDLSVNVDYYQDCAETKPYLTKTFTHQIGLSGNQFSDAGDSGALVVNAANAEPVGLFFAGGRDVAGVSQGVANPAPEVLSELSAQLGGSYSYVGGVDHAVSCLSYGDSTTAQAQARTLVEAERQRAQLAQAQARMLVNPAVGILGVGVGKSNDHPGEAAVILYTDEKMTASVPTTIGGVRTLVIPTTARAVMYSMAPQTPQEASAVQLTSTALSQAVSVKGQVATKLMKRNSAFFGVGVGQSLDNPREAALIIYVDRKHLPAQLPATIEGLRTRYVVMDRLHVTRSYAAAQPAKKHCGLTPGASSFNPFSLLSSSLKLP